VAHEIRIVIADDHPIFRQGLKQVIESDPSLKVVAEADDCDLAIARIREHTPEVAVLDVEMPGGDGFEVARSVRDDHLAVGLIFLTMYRDERLFNTALDIGVKGYVLKDSAVTDVVGAIKAVAAGHHFISPTLSGYLINRDRRAAALPGRVPGINSLSPTERQVIKLIAEYKTSREIADTLCVSVRTVEHHRANISVKLNLKGSHALLKFAVEHVSEF
jgi:DNA-binding NarL/FixJ family response regulator